MLTKDFSSLSCRQASWRLSFHCKNQKQQFRSWIGKELLVHFWKSSIWSFLTGWVKLFARAALVSCLCRVRFALNCVSIQFFFKTFCLIQNFFNPNYHHAVKYLGITLPKFDMGKSGILFLIQMRYARNKLKLRGQAL